MTPVDAADPFLLAPKDKDFFVWQKSASEFKSCNADNVQKSSPHGKGKQVTNQTDIKAYMTRLFTKDYRRVFMYSVDVF